MLRKKLGAEGEDIRGWRNLHKVNFSKYYWGDQIKALWYSQGDMKHVNNYSE
jgi:hypothetical protein